MPKSMSCHLRTIALAWLLLAAVGQQQQAGSSPPATTTDTSRSIAYMATNVTADFVQRYCTCSAPTSDRELQERLFPTFLQGAASFLQSPAAEPPASPAADGAQDTIRIQLDHIAAAPLIVDCLRTLNAPRPSPLLVANRTPPLSTLPEVAINRPTLPADGRWTDFPGGTFNELSLFLDPNNIRTQHHMLFRRDVLRAANVMSPPQTWQQLLDVAALVNGTDIDGDGLPDAALCFDAQATCGLPYLLLKILLPMLFYSPSTTKAIIWEPSTMTPLADTAAMREALTTYSRLVPYNTAVSGECHSVHPSFLAGKCAITFSFYPDIPTAPLLRGRLGTALPPGTTRIWDAPSNTLLSCTPSLCPFAVPARPPLPGQPPGTLVNFVPFNIPIIHAFVPHPNLFNDPSPALAAFGAIYTSTLTAIRQPFLSALAPLLPPPTPGQPTPSSSPPPPPSPSPATRTRQPTPATAQLAARLASLAADRPEIAPSARARWGQIDPSPYLERGNHPDDVAELLFTSAQVLSFSNNYDGLPVPGASYYRVSLGQAATDAAQPNANLTAILQTLAAQYLTVLQAFNNTALYRDLYWFGIGYKPPPPVQPADARPQARRKGPYWNQGSFAGVLVAITVLLLLVTAVLVTWRRVVKGRVSLMGKRLPPGLGESTTLLVTDIQSSTTLWKQLPPELMEQALAVHHSTLQKLLGSYRGYESATEGDSFILAFHSPHDALAYAVAAQQALLEADWPPQLLEVDELAPVVAVPRPTPPGGCHSAVIQTLQSTPTAPPSGSNPAPPFPTPPPFTRPLQRLLHWLRNLLSSCLAPSKRLGRCLPTWTHAPRQPHQQRQQQQGQQQQEQPYRQQQAQATYGRRASTDYMRARFSIDSTAAELELLARGGVPETVASCSFSWALSEAWFQQPPAAPATAPTPRTAGPATPSHRRTPPAPIWRGLRVRMGIHSGLNTPQLLSTNRTTGRTQYSGTFLAASQHVCDAGHGGQVLLSNSAFERLSTHPTRRPATAPPPLLLAMGEHILRHGEPSVGLYQAVVPGLEARLAALGPVRSLRVEVHGVAAAPIGAATVVFMRVSDLGVLMAWDAAVTQAALALLHEAVRLKVARHGGYIAELVDGLALVVFPRAVDAIKWALKVQQALLVADWSGELLQHTLCEPVVARVSVAMPDTGVTMEVQKLALRGLRLKAGIATGEVLDYISPATARIMYRGRVMNWAARIAGLASAGQVLCTEATWRIARQAPLPELQGLCVTPAGQHVLKGITGSVGLHCCSLVSRASRSAGMGSDGGSFGSPSTRAASAVEGEGSRHRGAPATAAGGGFYNSSPPSHASHSSGAAASVVEGDGSH